MGNKVSWLKQIGQDIVKGLKVFATVGKDLLPVAGGVIETLDPALTPVVGFLERATTVVVDAEAIGTANALSGPQKLAGATPLVQQLVLDSTAFAGKKIADPEGFAKAIAQLTSALADAWNCVEAEPAKAS